MMTVDTIAAIQTFRFRMRSYARLQKARARISNARRRGEVILAFAPSSLNLMMVDTCNSQCLMCGKDYKSFGSGAYLSLEDMKIIYNHLDMGQMVDVIYGGGGEPFLNPELAEIGEFTRRTYPTVQHLVISNGIAMNMDVAARLLGCGTHFLVSVNAATPETFQEIAGLDAFGRVTEHIVAVARMRDRMKSPAKITLSMILMRQNIEELPKFVRLARDLGADSVKAMYTRIYPESYRKKLGSAKQIKPEDSLYYHQRLSDGMMREAAALARRLKISFDPPPLFGDSFQVRQRDCDEPWKSLFINFNGDVYPCPASEILFRPKVDTKQYNSGNILRQHYKEFWNNRFWRELRRTNCGNGQQDVVPECQCCGAAICWDGPCREDTHILDWSLAEDSDLCL